MKHITKTSEVEALLPILLSKPTWGIDTETDGLCPHQNRVTLLQLGRYDEQYVIDARKASVEPLRPFLESKEYKKIGHNLKFDYKMLRGSFNIELEGARDTLLGEKIITAGKKKQGFGLEDVMDQYLHISLDKTLQKSFVGHKGEYSAEQIAYAANDVKHMIPLCVHMVELMKPAGLLPTFSLECDALAAFGDMEFDGMLIDVAGWRKLIKMNQDLLAEVKAEMDTAAEIHVGLNLFNEVDTNYDSPKQMVRLLNKMKMTVDGEPIKDTNKMTLKKLGNYPFIKQLMKMRGYQKRINTYGESFIKAINPVTGRIHPSLWQIGTETGRPAAGESAVNPLNIPRENSYRHCFICYPDEVMESDDYSGCESRILAEISGDPKMVEIFQNGEDIHCAVATMLYGKTVTKKENKELRTPAKSLNFGIAYGMGPNKLYNTLAGDGFPITPEQAKQLYYKYVDIFRVAVGFLRDSGKKALNEGYVANLNGRRRYWVKPNPYIYEGGVNSDEYKGRLAAIEREGGNFLIQSVNADMTKLAMTRIRDYRKKNKIRTSFVNAIYDELVTRTHKDDSVSFHAEKLRLMKESAQFWMKTVPMEVDGSTNPYWTKG